MHSVIPVILVSAFFWCLEFDSMLVFMLEMLTAEGQKNSEEFNNCTVHWQKKMEVKTILYRITIWCMILQVQSLLGKY